MTSMSGWCMDANDLHWRLNKDMTFMHDRCKVDCNCWHHTPGKRQTKEPAIEGKGRSKKITRAKQTVDTVTGNDQKTGQPKLNLDGSVAKKRGRPKGSKNKVKA